MAKSTKTSAPVSPVMVVAGEDLFQRNQHLAEIQVAALGEGDPGMGLIRIDPAQHGGGTMAVILDECRTGSMFAPKKLVIVDPADPLFKKTDEDDAPLVRGERPQLTNREMLENYIESPCDTAVLVLVCETWLKTTRIHKSLDKLGAVRWAQPIKDFQVPPWIIRQAREVYGKSIDAAATERLADLIGADLQRLDNELAKLSLYEPDSPAISVKAVDSLVGFQHEQQIWDMINALAAKDSQTALRKIDELWQLDPNIKYTVAGAVFFWLNQVLRARELVERRLPDGAIAAQLKLWPQERAQKVLSVARSWSPESAGCWSQAMLQMDIANKTSLGEPRMNLEKFVVQFCTA